MPAGHPTHLTPKIREQITNKLRRCSSITAACGVAGITTQTFYNWINRGELALTATQASKKKILLRDKPYVEFFDAVKKAEADAEENLLEAILTGRLNWQSSAWWLERRFPRVWAKMNMHEVSGPDGKALQTESKVSAGLTPQTAAAIRAEILGIGKEGEGPDDE